MGPGLQEVPLGSGMEKRRNPPWHVFSSMLPSESRRGLGVDQPTLPVFLGRRGFVGWETGKAQARMQGS